MVTIFRPKLAYQKDNCLFCRAEATLEAVNGRAEIRCCEKESCKKAAKEMAETSEKRIPK